MSYRNSRESSCSSLGPETSHGTAIPIIRRASDDRGDYDELELGDLSDTAHLRPTSFNPRPRSGRTSPVGKGDSTSSVSATSSSTLRSRTRAIFEHAKSTFGISKSVSRDERENTRPGNGLWTELMLVDRSLRTMAGLTTLFAITMIIVCIAYASAFAEHIEDMPNSTSVRIARGSHASMTRKSEGFKFLINLAATMVLGMSNTYQQLLTALKVDDLKHVLFKYGDSRVGTNSPFSINHKREGRVGAWLAWILLICTSMNSSAVLGYGYPDFDCYSALRMNEARLDPQDWPREVPGNYDPSKWGAHRQCPANRTAPDRSPLEQSADDENYYTDITVDYKPGSPCEKIMNKATSLDEVWHEYDASEPTSNCTIDEQVEGKNCHSAYHYPSGCTTDDFNCKKTKNGTDEEVAAERHQTWLVMRMQAAIILAACLSIKASYMVAINIKDRDQVKSNCLTYGDILVASNLDPDLRIPNESMVNSGDFWRRSVAHTCHKHCKGTRLSETGEELGHCQKCSKHNTVNNVPGLPWPALSTKRKKSLITNLGQTALTQMLTLSFSSVAMIGASVFIAIMFVSMYSYAVCVGWTSYTKQFAASQQLATMTLDSLGGEIAAFMISNGAQLIYSCLYLLLIYNITLISMEYEWGNFEKGRQRLRCTIVKSDRFDESYFLQLPKKIIIPIMIYSVLMHWLLGLAILAEETIVTDGIKFYSRYNIITVPDGVWGSSALLLAMTACCWWAYTYKREGFIPQMFGSIRTLCAATSKLDDFPTEGIHWGELDTNEIGAFRHAGLSAGEVGEIVPNEIYA